jgi:Fe-S-cluster containining protein
MSDYSPQLLASLQKFYEELDHHISQIEEKNKSRINCRKGCFSCCKDELEVFGIEAENITQKHAELLNHGEPYPIGMCAFLDNEGACRIYTSRPFVCRTHGVPISYLQEDEEGEYELLDICPLNEAGKPLETLENEEIFENKPYEEELVRLQIMADKGNFHRVALRTLFK